MIADCGDLLVLDRHALTYRVARHFDLNGAKVRVIEHVVAADTLVNSATGVGYTTTARSTAVIDPQRDRAVFTGVIYRLAIPGAGAVFLDVGRVTADRQGNVSFQAGPHQFYDGDVAGLCAALA